LLELNVEVFPLVPRGVLFRHPPCMLFLAAEPRSLSRSIKLLA